MCYCFFFTVKVSVYLCVCAPTPVQNVYAYVLRFRRQVWSIWDLRGEEVSAMEEERTLYGE